MRICFEILILLYTTLLLLVWLLVHGLKPCKNNNMKKGNYALR